MSSSKRNPVYLPFRTGASSLLFNSLLLRRSLESAISISMWNENESSLHRVQASKLKSTYFHTVPFVLPCVCRTTQWHHSYPLTNTVRPKKFHPPNTSRGQPKRDLPPSESEGQTQFPRENFVLTKMMIYWRWRSPKPTPFVGRMAWKWNVWNVFPSWETSHKREPHRHRNFFGNTLAIFEEKRTLSLNYPLFRWLKKCKGKTDGEVAGGRNGRV